MSDVREIIPVWRRIVYLRRLFHWLSESLEASRHSTANGYPELPVILLESLERMGDEIASVTLLKYCDKLRALNVRIRATKGLGADAQAVDLQLGDLPDAQDQYEAVRRDCLKTVVAWLIIPTLIIPMIALRSCCS
jgi:hypothetical protein